MAVTRVRKGGNRNVEMTGFKPNDANVRLARVNKLLGIDGITKQQATTRVIYDSIKLQASTQSQTLRFFKDLRNKAFPLTNLNQNKLNVGETMAIERFYFHILQTTVGDPTDVQGVITLQYFAEFARLYASEMTYLNAQNQLVVQYPLSSQLGVFNKDSKFGYNYQISSAPGAKLEGFNYQQEVVNLDNPIVIPQQIEFEVDLQIPKITLPAISSDFYLVCKLEGLGTLFAPKSTY
jgi:hypothetical protein